MSHSRFHLNVACTDTVRTFSSSSLHIHERVGRPTLDGHHRCSATLLFSEIVRVGGSRPGSWRADCMRQVRRSICRIAPRPKGRWPRRCYESEPLCRAEDRPVFSTFSLPPQVPVEPTREREASRGRSGTRRWSAERRRVSAIDHHQAIGDYSCFRKGRNHLG